MNNKEILNQLAHNLFMRGCGTSRIREIETIGREKYYSEKKDRLLNLLNQLDKSALPNDKLTELEELINKKYSLTERNAEELTNERKKGKEIFKELLYQNEDLPYWL